MRFFAKEKGVLLDRIIATNPVGWTSPAPFSYNFLPRRPKKGDRNMKEKKRIGHDDRINLQTKVELFFSRINSYVRGSNENRTPYERMLARFGEGFMEAIGVKRIPGKEVLLKPSLFK